MTLSGGYGPAMPTITTPLKLKPIYKDKVWGGATLREQLSRQIPSDSVGESWELVDLASTSASGGGGGSEFSVVDGGPHTGQTLHALIETDREAVLGTLPLSPEGGFPILLKYLDANRNLSVQVHPSPEYAAEHDDAFLKSESWYIVHAEPDAVIYKGLKAGVTPEQVRAALQQNTDEAVVPLLEAFKVQPGDCHYLPSGTCHALGGGILVAEVQTPSDTTFRVYDWGREGRELHVDQALACMTFGPAETRRFDTRMPLGDDRGTHASVASIVRCEHFHVDEVTARPGYADTVGRPGEPVALMLIRGGVELACEGSDGVVSLVAGDTALLPAALRGGRVTVQPIDPAGDALWLEVSFPRAGGSRMA